MVTLAADSARTLETGIIGAHPVIASDIIYEGAAVGENSLGYARPLVAADRFLGFAEQNVDNSSGSAGDKNVRVRNQGKIQLSVTGAVITDLGQPVYASDDDTFSFAPAITTVSNSFVGIVDRFVSSGIVIVRYDINNISDPYGNAPREVLSANKTLDVQDNGKVFFIDTDATTTTLPAEAIGINVKIVNIGAEGAVAINISPAAADLIHAPDIAGTDDKDHINTKATAKRGDYCTLISGLVATGHSVTDQKGIWTQEG